MLRLVLLCLLVFFTVTSKAESILSSASDSVNSGIINTKIFADSALSGININATVTNGVAMFSGEVRSEAQLNELIKIGKSVSGIRAVDVSKVKIQQIPVIAAPKS